MGARARDQPRLCGLLGSLCDGQVEVAWGRLLSRATPPRQISTHAADALSQGGPMCCSQEGGATAWAEQRTSRGVPAQARG